VAAFQGLIKMLGTTCLGRDRVMDVCDPLRGEVQAFDTQYPAIASSLINAGFLPDPLSHTPIPPGFPDGLWLIRPPFPVAGRAVVAALERFSEGDWGDYGTRTVRPLEPLEEWSLRIQARRVRNEGAASSGFGIVVEGFGAKSIRREPGRIFVMARLVSGLPRATLVGWWSGCSTPFPTVPGAPDPDDQDVTP
jgi:hypothetical protein